VEPYIFDLTQRGYAVRLFLNVDEAWTALQADLTNVELLILDVMMSPGRQFREAESEYGLRTGVRLYEKVREIAADLPIIVLTNVTDDVLAERLRGQGAPWFGKYETFADEFGESVDQLLGRGIGVS
jgi:DNA-binding response OmpR family regulator